MHWIENVWIYIASLTWLKHLISLPFDGSSPSFPSLSPSLNRQWKSEFRHKDLLVCNLGGWGWCKLRIARAGCYSCRRSTNKLQIAIDSELIHIHTNKKKNVSFSIIIDQLMLIVWLTISFICTTLNIKYRSILERDYKINSVTFYIYQRCTQFLCFLFKH